MEWLAVEDEDNQDMQHEYIGELILQKGFKVRYNNVEVYTDKMRKHMEQVFKAQGYTIQIKYNNTYAHMEITAVKTQAIENPTRKIYSQARVRGLPGTRHQNACKVPPSKTQWIMNPTSNVPDES